jgi:hypothetical protein
MQKAIFWTVEEVATKAKKLYADKIRLPLVGYANETDEATATDWIDLQIEALGVSLT